MGVAVVVAVLNSGLDQHYGVVVVDVFIVFVNIVVGFVLFLHYKLYPSNS